MVIRDPKVTQSGARKAIFQKKTAENVTNDHF